MERNELCRECRQPAKDYASNMTRDAYGELIRCSSCVVMKEIERRRKDWNRNVKGLVRRLEPYLQEYYEHELVHGTTLRNFMFNMRENGRSPEEAVRTWRHRAMYGDPRQATK